MPRGGIYAELYIIVIHSFPFDLTHKQLMEVQPHCLLKNSVATPSASIQRSKSMMTSSMSCYKPQPPHTTTRFISSGSSSRQQQQHHAVEIHHPDDGSGLQSPSVAPSATSPVGDEHQTNNSLMVSSHRRGNFYIIFFFFNYIYITTNHPRVCLVIVRKDF